MELSLSPELSACAVGQPAGEFRDFIGVRRPRPINGLSVCPAGCTLPPLQMRCLQPLPPVLKSLNLLI